MARIDLVTVLAWEGTAFAVIESSTTYKLNLTDVKEAPKKAKWSDPDRIEVTGQGLGWGSRDDEGSRDFWVQTAPIGIGLSWRPTSGASIKATVMHTGTAGLLYARYSVDARRWTAWQLLESAGKGRTTSFPTEVFQGTLRVPHRESARYHELRLEYSRRDDVPWRSDEEALVKEIFKREPAFFEKTTPFIGYVQFLYEAQLHGGDRVKGIQADFGWIVGGKHHAPKDEKSWEGRDLPWRFEAP